MFSTTIYGQAWQDGCFPRPEMARDSFYPAPILAGRKLHYTVDSLSLMKYYVTSGFFSLAGMEKITGINQKQLWSYLHGTKPRKAQSNRITAGFEKLRNELNAILA